MRKLPPIADDPNDPSNVDPDNTDPAEDGGGQGEDDLDDNGYPFGTEYNAEGEAIDDQNNPFGTVYAEDGTTPIEDENGNPFGTEYNEDGTPILTDPATDPDADPPAARRTLAPLTTAVTLTSEQRALLEEKVDPETLDILQFIVSQQIQAAQASMVYANSAVELALADASQEFRAHVMPAVTQFLAAQTPEFRATPHAAEQAILVALAQEHSSGDASLIDVMSKYVDLYKGTRARQPARPAPPAVRAPITRTGKPSNGQAPPASRRNGSARVSALEKTLRMSASELSRLGLDE